MARYRITYYPDSTARGYSVDGASFLYPQHRIDVFLIRLRQYLA